MPTTPEGKDISSKNATKHGIFSKRTILEDESQAEYDRLVDGWYEQWEPADFQEYKLVNTLIRNDWWHQRAERRLLEAEAHIADKSGVNPQDWTAEEQHLLEKMQRYKTTTERAFYRAWSALQGLRKDVMRENDKTRKVEAENGFLKSENEALRAKVKPEKPQPQPQPEEAEPLSKAELLFQGQRSKKKRKKIVYLDQWVEVEVSPSGKTVTTAYPSNEILIADGQKKWPPPEFVYRRFNFVDGVPEEYAWATDDETTRELGGMGMQRMTVDTWLDLIEEEKELGTGHMLPTLTLPRPEEVHINLRLADKPRAHIGCDCKVCTHSKKVLEEAA